MSDYQGIPGAAVDLLWLPLGAGGNCVRLSGKTFEAVGALTGGRPRRDLYHSALEITASGGFFTIETAPVEKGDPAGRGVLSTGAVGSRVAGRWRIFRYELRCWRGGAIPDRAYAVESPRRLTDDPAAAQRILDLVPSVPMPVWGRDALRTGEMWNSNSVIAWLLARSGLPTDAIEPPRGGRAPGWNAGLVVAQRGSRGLP
jgi:hypothetical protein